MKLIFNKSVMVILLLLSIYPNARGQTVDSSQQVDNQLMYRQYLKKSHSQKVTSIVLTSIGIVMGGTGIILALSNMDGFFDPNHKDKDYGSAPDILGIGGLSMILTAVPLAIASRKNEDKAKLYLQKEAIIRPGIKNSNSLVSIGIKIEL